MNGCVRRENTGYTRDVALNGLHSHGLAGPGGQQEEAKEEERESGSPRTQRATSTLNAAQ